MSIIYKGFLSGLSHHSYERFKGVLGKGTLLQLKAMPANQFDNYSVAVFFEGVQIGWIPKGQNAEVHSILQVCDQVECVIVDHLNSYGDLRMRLAVEVSLWNYPGPGANKTATMLQQQLERNRQRQVAAKQGQPAQGQPEQPQPCTTILRTTINTSPTIEKEITMTNKITAIASGIAASNFSAAKTAAVMEAGRIANVEITKVLAKRLPMMVKGYADTPAGRLVVANLAGVALQQFRPDDARLKALVDAMQVQAYQELLQTIDIEGFIDGLLENPKIKNAVGRLTAED